jgi:hypothetical protein
VVLCPGLVACFQAICFHLDDAELVSKALKGVMECATLVRELGCETSDGVGARLFYGREPKANRIHRARRLSLQCCAPGVYLFK